MKIDFVFESKYGKFSDALWFPDDQPLPSDDEIEAMKQQRFDNWIAIIESPPTEDTEVTPQE